MPARTRERRSQYEFTLVFEDVDALEPSNPDRRFEAGCDDATCSQVDAIGYADFSREAPSAPEAMLCAIDDIESAVPGVRVIRVEPDEFVSASDIATRLGRTR